MASEESGEAHGPPAPRESEDEELVGEIEDEVTPNFGALSQGGWMSATFSSGPLPPASELDQYETTLPGTADRLLRISERAMDLMEKEAAQRHAIETKIVDANVTNQSRGQIIATFFGVVGFAAAIAFVVTGRNTAAFIAVLVPLGAFISRFIRVPPNGGD